jgi:hypothetical protein
MLKYNMMTDGFVFFFSWYRFDSNLKKARLPYFKFFPVYYLGSTAVLSFYAT